MEEIKEVAAVEVPEITEITEVDEGRAANASLRAMARGPVVEAVPGEPIAPGAVVPAAEPVSTLKEFTYTYQIVDEDGRPVGSPQVQKYEAEKELPISTFASAIKAHTHSTLEIRRLKRKQTFEVPNPELTDVEKLDGDIVEFKPRPLSADENFSLSQDLQDPAKAAAARAKITEAELGAPAAAVGTTLNRLQERNLRLQARVEVADFLASNPGYYKCQDNFKKLTEYMGVNDMTPTAANFQKAYDILLKDGFLLTGPNVREVAPVQGVTPEVVPAPQVNSQPAQDTPVSGITDPAPAAETRPLVRIPSGLTRTTTSDEGAKPQQRSYTKAEEDKMSSEEYKRLVVEPEFKARRAASRAS